DDGYQRDLMVDAGLEGLGDGRSHEGDLLAGRRAREHSELRQQNAVGGRRRAHVAVLELGTPQPVSVAEPLEVPHLDRRGGVGTGVQVDGSRSGSLSGDHYLPVLEDVRGSNTEDVLRAKTHPGVAGTPTHQTTPVRATG